MSDITDIIYESLNSGKMTKNAARNLLLMAETFNMDYELDLAMDEMEVAESAFMESSLSYSSGEEEFSVFEKKAETFGDKIKKAWEAFKKWVKSIIDAVGKKIAKIKDKITGKEDKGVFSKLPLDKINNFLKHVVDHLKPPYSNLEKITAGFIGFGVYANVYEKYKFDIVDGIRNSLIKIDGKLLEIENKTIDNGSKIISILRPIVNLAHKAIMTAVSKENSDEQHKIDEFNDFKAGYDKIKNDHDHKVNWNVVESIRDEVNTYKKENLDPAAKSLSDAERARDEAANAVKSADSNDEVAVKIANNNFANAAIDVENAYNKWNSLFKEYNKLIERLKKVEKEETEYAYASVKYAELVMKTMFIFIRKNIVFTSNLIDSTNNIIDVKKVHPVFDNYIAEIENYLKQTESAASVLSVSKTTRNMPLSKLAKIRKVKSDAAKINNYRRDFEELKKRAAKRGF